MQGESDTTMEKANKYYSNQLAFVNYLRNDLKNTIMMKYILMMLKYQIVHIVNQIIQQLMKQNINYHYYPIIINIFPQLT